MASRVVILSTLVFVCFVVLFWRLWSLQVLAAEGFNELARDNRIRTVRTYAPRGRILDRDGVVLVSNRISDVVTLDRTSLDSRETRSVIRLLGDVTGVDPSDLRARLADPAASPYQPVPVLVGVSADVRYRILENQEDLPGVSVEKHPVREYPAGATAAHVLGYVGEISREQLRSPYFRRNGYGPTDVVGKSGVELTYDRWLRGVPGEMKVIVDATGNVIARRETAPARPGRDLVLSVDLDVQRVAEDALRAAATRSKASGGSVVVMDPRAGGVLAMASLPSYDPAVLADGISTREFARLNGQAASPFLNRATQGERPPGSTFKVVTAGAALAHGIIEPTDRVACPGAATYPPNAGSGSVTFRNWSPTDNGLIDVARSLEISCDTFYYELGWRLETRFGSSVGGDRSDRFQRYIRNAGFGRPTGIDLPAEGDGTVPDRRWCRANSDLGYCPDGWVPGYTINMSIGQGDLVVTPAQLAVSYAALANGGKVLEPRVAARVVASEDGKPRKVESRVRASLPLKADDLAVIRRGLLRVVEGGEGTARAAFSGFPLDRYPVAGKTGTAETADGRINDAWFAAYAPADDPRFVVAVYLEKTKGFHGGEVAAPVAREVFEELLHIDERTRIRLGRDHSG